VPKLANGSNTQTLTVYAQIPAGQYPAMGSYTDTITATVFVGGVSFATTTFSVTVTVAANCTISATSLAFGNYAGVLIDSSSTITVTCTNTSTYNVGLNAGTATGATVTNRSVTGPSSALLSYDLFSNSAYTANWGNTVGTDTVAGTGTGSAQFLTVYGQIPAGQSAAPGSYTDTITATITY
jgi:spore coat protein U-like protein